MLLLSGMVERITRTGVRRDDTVSCDRGIASRMAREEFEGVVDRALEEIRRDIVERLDNLIVVVEEQDPYDEGLLGLYEGIPLSDRGIDYAGVLPDRISIFVDSHLAMGLDRAGTAEQIRRTVLHEIAHHLGIGDRRLHELGWG